MLMGMGAGMLVARFLDEAKAKKVVIIALIVSGAALMITNIF